MKASFARDLIENKNVLFVLTRLIFFLFWFLFPVFVVSQQAIPDLFQLHFASPTMDHFI